MTRFLNSIDKCSGCGSNESVGLLKHILCDDGGVGPITVIEILVVIEVLNLSGFSYTH